MEQMKSSVHPGDEVANNLSPVSEKDFSEEAIVFDDKKELNDIEGEVNICDTCGVLGYKNMLVICHNCGVGAEHTYCMVEKFEDVPEKWSCYDCVEDTGSIRKKSKASVDLFEIGESALQKQNDLSTQMSSETVGLDLNLTANPRLDLSPDPSIALNANPNLELNVDNNLDLSLDCGSSYRWSSTSNFQAHTRMRASPPLVGQGSLEEEEEDQWAKRRRVDTRLSL